MNGSASGQILKMEPPGHADGPEGGCEETEGSCTSGRLGVPLPAMGKMMGGRLGDRLGVQVQIPSSLRCRLDPGSI